jgi:type I restriction enzyme S subunit
VTSFPKYERYKDSGIEWVEKIPSHWDVKPGRVTLSLNKEKNAGNIEETVLSLSYGRLVIKPPEKMTGLVPESLEGYQIINPGDIIIRPTDLQNDWTSLRVGLAKDRGIITSAYLGLKHDQKVSSEYLYYLLHSYDLLKVYYGMGTGLRQNLSWDDFKYLPLTLPPKPEQDRIVTFLDQKTAEIGALIAKKQRQIELLDEQKAILINRAVTRGLNPNAKLKPSGIEWIGGIPEHWEVVPLKRNAIVQTGLTLGKDYPPSRSVEVPYLRVANVQNGHLALGSVTTLRVPKSLVPRYALEEGDVLVAEGGDLDKLGRGCVWRSEIETCMHQNHVFAVRPYPGKILPEFLSLALSCKYGQRYFMLTGKQTTNLASTNSTALMNFPVALPLVEEQAEILKALDKIKIGFQNLIRLIESETQSLKSLRSTLTAHAVTGRIKVQ